MAVINNHKTHSTIQIRKDIYFVFGSLEMEGEAMEKIKFAIDEMRNYFSLIGEPAPDVQMNWRTAQEGEWVVSDDHRVIQILKRTENKSEKTPNPYNKAIIRTCVGTFAVNPKTFFDTDFELHEDRYRVSNTGKESIERMVDREKATNNEILFAKRVAQGEDVKNAYMNTFPTSSESYAKEMSKILLRQERIQKSISSEVEQILEEEGVTKRYIIQRYRDLINDGMADLRYCSGSVVRALDSLVDISGMKPDKTKSSQSMGVLHKVEDDLLDEVENVEFSVIENGTDQFEQKYAENGDESATKVEKMGNNLLIKSGTDLLK
jgi:hypothetical protein